MVNGDPLDALSPFGVRVIWAHDLDGDVLLLEGHAIALADVDLSRSHVADLVLALLTRRPRA